jgi:circadian clock protein KaiC
MHLALMHKLVNDFKPQAVVVDPISNFISQGTMSEAGAMLVRLVDFLKEKGITSVFTNLTHGAIRPEETDVGISSVIDTWLLLRDNEGEGERSGVLYVLKSRGMPHSKKVMGFRLTDNGAQLAEAGSPHKEPRT